MAATTSIIDRLGTWLLSILDKDTWGIIGNWFNGLATMAVVFLALGLQAWYERRRRPKLRVVYSATDDNDNRYVRLNELQMPIERPDGEDQKVEELWLRINVFNDSKITAKDVELRFIHSTMDGSPVKEDRPSWWFKVANLNKFSIAVPPKFKQPFDIAYVKNSANIDEDISFFLATVPPDLDLHKWADVKAQIESELSNKLRVGALYRFVFSVVSSNADAKYYELKLKVAERSPDDIAKKHLQTKDVLRRRLEVSGPALIDEP